MGPTQNCKKTKKKNKIPKKKKKTKEKQKRKKAHVGILGIGLIQLQGDTWQRVLGPATVAGTGFDCEESDSPPWQVLEYQEPRTSFNGPE
jgi:hypothetical protein